MSKQSNFIKNELFKFLKEEYTSAGTFHTPNPQSDHIEVNSTNVIDEKLNKDVADDLIIKAFDNLNIHDKPNYEGAGSAGVAYSVGNRVFKLTTDPSEAAQAIKLKGENNKYLADIYGVYDIQKNSVSENNTKNQHVYLIVSEKLRTDVDTFGELEENLEELFINNLQIDDYLDILQVYRDNKQEYLEKFNEPIKKMLENHPHERFYWNALMNITDELREKNIKSIDLLCHNLGYKKNGKIGFFDFGYGHEKAPKGLDTLKLENQIFERIMSYMPDVSAVKIKKKCQINGNGDGTSEPCNQGDINSLELTKINEEKKTKVEYGVLMLYFEIDNWNEVTSMVAKEDIYDKPTFGIETEPHITILYGFHKEVTLEQVQTIINSIIDVTKEIQIELNEVSCFETPQYDVLKFDVVVTEILKKLNKACKELPYTSNFPDYHPHMTISYLNKGTGKKYGKKFKKNIKLQSNKFIFSQKNGEKMMLKPEKKSINENIVSVNTLPFKSDIETAGGKIYSVGGAVRDTMLNKESKDLDLLITGLPLEDIETILSKYGRVDNVGKSFGVIKFNNPETGELDIAIPRTEKANGEGGYKGFEVTSDHTLPIEADLSRRDYTLNAIAKDSNGQIIDPYNGTEDIKNKIIRMVNPQAFAEDPLRLLRGMLLK